jgi:hypothetical protein
LPEPPFLKSEPRAQRAPDRTSHSSKPRLRRKPEMLQEMIEFAAIPGKLVENLGTGNA